MNYYNDIKNELENNEISKKVTIQFFYAIALVFFGNSGLLIKNLVQ